MENMIEIRVQVSDFMSYDICIPSRINPKTFGEVMKRLKGVHDLIPDIPKRVYKRGVQNPLYALELEEAKDVQEKYATMNKEDFIEFLATKYGIHQTTWKNVVAMMGRLRSLMREDEVKQKQ